MFLTTYCEYALRAMTHLAAYGKDGPIPVKDIAEQEEIPNHFLAKILNDLVRKELVIAVRGPGGGFVLARPASEMFVSDVVDRIDGLDVLNRRCVLGLEECRDDQPCPMHEYWKTFRGKFLDQVSGLSLTAMGSTLIRKRLQLDRRAKRKRSKVTTKRKVRRR